MRILQIDGGNLYHGLKDYLASTRVDFAALKAHFRADRALYYNVRGPGMGAFLTALEAAGYELRLGHLRQGPAGWQEKGVDVLLAVDMVRLAARGAREIVLVSGDEDLVPAVREARRLGARVVVAAFQGLLSMQLAAAANEVKLLDGLPWNELRYVREVVR